MNKVLLPAKLEVQGTNPVSAVSLGLLEPGAQGTQGTQVNDG